MPYKQGYSVFGMKSFEFPLGTSNILVWPQLLWDFLNVHFTDTTVLALVRGIPVPEPRYIFLCFRLAWSDKKRGKEIFLIQLKI